MKRFVKNTLKIILWSIGSVLMLLVLCVLLIRLPAVQNFITHKIVNYVSGKTHTRISLRRLYIGYPKTIVMEDLFAEDNHHDTLLAVKKLAVDINMLALINKRVDVSSVMLSNATAFVNRNNDSIYNFSFLIKAFTSSGKKTVVIKNTIQTDTSGGWQIVVDRVALENIRGGFSDSIGGTTVKGFVGKLNLDMKAVDIKHLSFNGNELYLSNANVSLVQNKQGAETPDTSITLMPLLSLNKLQLHRVSFIYENKINGQLYDIHAGNALILPEKIDLNAHVIKVRRVNIDSTSGIIAMRRNPVDTSTKPTAFSGTSGAPWQISGDSLKLAGIDFRFDITNAPHLNEGVDYNHLGLTRANIDISNAFYSPDKITGTIHNISLKEQSGFELKQLSARVLYDEKHAQLQELNLLTNRSHLGNFLSVSYPSLASIGKDVGVLGVEGNFKNTEVALQDILMFAPQLKNLPIFIANRGKTLTLTGRVTGLVKDLKATGLSVSVSGGTKVALDAYITGLPDALNAFYDVHIQSLHTNAGDLKQLIGTYLPSSINVPNEINLSGAVKGSIKDAHAKLQLETSSGNASVDATFKMMPGDTCYTAQINTEALNIGYIMKQDSLLGTVTLTANATGSGISLNNISGSVKAVVQSLMLNKYNYRNLDVSATAEHGNYSADVVIKDSNLVMNLQAAASFVKDSEYIKASGHIEGVDLQKIKLLRQDIRASALLSVNLTGDLQSLNGTAALGNIVVMKGSDTYHIDSLLVTSVNDSNHAALNIQSPIVNADYDGNTKLQNLPAAIIHQINRYFRITNDSATAPVDTNNENFKLKVEIEPHPVIGLILPGLEGFTGADIVSSFSKKDNALKLNANISALAYGPVKAGDVHLTLASDAKDMQYGLSLETLEAGPVRLAETFLSGSVADNMAQFAMRIHGKDTVDKLKITGNFNQDSTKAFVLRIDNAGLILNNEKWNLPQDNYLRFGSKGFVVHDLVLSNKAQLLSANTDADNSETIRIKFDSFQLGTLSQIIERDTELVRGQLDGHAELRNLQHAPAFVSDLLLSNIFFKTSPVGNLSVKADNLSADKYTAQVLLNGFENDVKASGYYSTATEDNQLNFKVDITKLNVSSVEPFSMGQLRRSSGYITGNMDLTGTITKPSLNGDVRFKDVAFNLAYINNYLTLKDEHIAIDPKGIYFRSFNILDSLKQKASIAGAVYTSDFKHMNFDLNITTDNFTVLNTTIKDNSLFFGKVLLNSNISVTGNEQLPVVNANVKLLKGSNVDVVIPSSKISTDRGEGVVVLTDSAARNSLMNPKDTLLITSGFKGINLNANVEITKESSFKLIVDKTSGDSLVVNGDAILSFSMDESGNQSLTGTYNLQGGGYRASFQKVIKRELKLQPGGSITWNGGVTDATVDITAIYTVKTSPADLLSSELANATPEERNTYKNLLNFNVLMTMKGDLMKPDISFKLDMNPEDQNALGGTVYAKVTSLNNDPSELNKQVFALLVMNKFIPASIGGGGGDATNYGDVATSLARNSVNQILTNELNALSGRFIKGVDINVGINANDQYTSTGVTQNTQISASVKKSFFKERLSVQVGTSINVQNDNGAIKGADAQSLTGDIVLEYKVNKDGSLRFKAFRQNQYEDFIDGLISETGVGIVYNRDFNKFKELLVRRKKAKPAGLPQVN